MLLRSPVFPPYYRMSAFHGSTLPKMTCTVVPSCMVTVLICVSPAAVPCLLQCLEGLGFLGTRCPGDQVGAFSGGGASREGGLDAM